MRADCQQRAAGVEIPRVGGAKDATDFGHCVRAFVHDGDLIELDVAERKLNLKVSDAELARRRAAWKAPPQKFSRGYGALYQKHITQADQGCDFDFLEGTTPTADPEIH